MLSAEQILDAVGGNGSLKPTSQQAWGGEVFVMRMTADQRDGLDLAWGRQRDLDDNKGVGYRAYVVAWCLCDDGNAPLFRDQDGDKNHSDMWGKLRLESASIVDRLFESAAKINGIMPEDEDAALNAAAKN